MCSSNAHIFKGDSLKKDVLYYILNIIEGNKRNILKYSKLYTPVNHFITCSVFDGLLWLFTCLRNSK